MKFCYCPECKELHPKNWHTGRSCRMCNGTCTIIVVPNSYTGYLMYFFSALAALLIVIYLLDTKWALSDYSVPLIFGALIAAFVCSFVEIGKATELAHERLRKKA